MAFLYEDFAQVVMAGHFELVNSEGVVISQVIWSRVVGPGFVARMRLLQTPISTKTGYSDAEEEPDSLDEQVNPRVDPKAQSGDGVSFEASADLPPTRRPDSLRPSVSTVETVEMAKTTATPNSHAEIDRAPTVSSPRSLGCEFKPWTGCQRSFGLEEDEVGQWIRHAEDDHLRGDYPSRCICWFCDDVEFRAEQSFDAGMNFEYL
ncbi:hypothetical protein CGCSCA5_v009502 [Colletotrichum siamense]|nr:hypothetical protein CGCSCA5_v009502 [Colletotrichum siamense]KAF4871062.1 hypothetical protein CGCSCA1_v009662 [Colletotrichum siamense]